MEQERNTVEGVKFICIMTANFVHAPEVAVLYS
jgi:hypothetical protein